MFDSLISQPVIAGLQHFYHAMLVIFITVINLFMILIMNWTSVNPLGIQITIERAKFKNSIMLQDSKFTNSIEYFVI